MYFFYPTFSHVYLNEGSHMDNQRFDRLARGIAAGMSRRSMLKGLLGGAFGVAGAGMFRRGADAGSTLGDACAIQGDCLEGVCENGVCSQHAGSPCPGGIPCRTGAVCQNDICAVGQGETCNGDEWCTTGFCATIGDPTEPCIPVTGLQTSSLSCHCEVVPKFCVEMGDACADSGECCGSLACIDGACSLIPDGSSCSFNEHCESGICVDSDDLVSPCVLLLSVIPAGATGCVCIPAEEEPECTEDADCEAGQTCTGDGLCATAGECGQDDDCTGGTCVEAVCVPDEEVIIDLPNTGSGSGPGNATGGLLAGLAAVAGVAALLGKKAADKSEA